MADYPVASTIVASIPVAVVRRRASAADLSNLVPAGCGEVWRALQTQNIRGGRNIAIYWDTSIRLEAGVEVDVPFQETGEVVRSATPAGPAASTVHLGPYQQLGAAHDAIQRWCAGNQFKPGACWEFYGHWQEAWNTNPSLIRTDVFYQIRPA